ncbi:GGDEF domain-containing protein [Marinomonas sp. GJ51-6]|uniref:GGDEF domain-containing protein n=1 Tax=Marinomonas sp. GJ51-6 TaxID=2992802 RepID=UPI0029351BF9|nr:GGDEF domain-containing protein [Marinomonas sp. GJ51-6]WOD06262.1 GGDEF domain-containing protein [Marinomonas sp. GJ51-6]
MTPFIRAMLRKLGRVGLVSILTISATALACLINYLLVKAFNFTDVLLEDIVLITCITFTVTPLLSWFLIGLFFKIDSLEVQMAELASIDSLTQVYNRGYFYQESKRTLAELSATADSQTSKETVNRSAVLLLDLDDLKVINDKLGHVGGDNVLMALSSILSDFIKKPNLVGRFGGDEFVVFLKQTNSVDLERLINSILKDVRAYEVDVEGEKYHFTVSIGAAFINMNDGKPLERSIKMADAALYEVKKSNRNGYVTYEGDS